jgi:hypothetical protein
MMAVIPSDFHRQLSPANLFDANEMTRDWISAICRGESHGTATSQSVIWNTTGRVYGYTTQLIPYIVDSGQAGYGYVIGTQGPASAVRIDPSTKCGNTKQDWLEGEGVSETLEPQSLYEDQLFRRTGKTVIRRQYAEGSWQVPRVNITVEPNPMTEKINISFDKNIVGAIHKLPLRICIFDNAGNVVYHQVGAPFDYAQDNTLLQWCGTDIAGNPVNPGIYFYSIIVDRTEYSGRIIKVK